MFAHVVGANCNSPSLQITHVTIRPHVEGLIAISPYTGVIRTFANIHVNTQKRHHGHGVSTFACVVGANCNSPTLQFTHVTIRSMLLRVFSLKSPTLQIRPYCKLPMLQITHVFNCPHVEGLIAISPYTGVIRTFANIRVNTQKRHHGHGMGSFVCVVGANCNSPMSQFAPIANRPCFQLPPCGRANCN